MYKNKDSRHILPYTLVAVFSFLIGWQATSLGFIDEAALFVSGQDSEEDFLENPSEDINLDLFWNVWGIVDDKFVYDDRATSQERVHGSIKGMINSLGDPYTVFMTPEESQEFTDSLEGTLEGIGAELTVENQNLVIVSPLRNSPAEKAGLLPDDIIYAIEDELASEMNLFQAITKIRGEKGTTVKLSIIRSDVVGPFDVSIVRDSIDIESVTFEKLDNGIFYLGVNQFNEKTNDEFGKAVSEIILEEKKGVIVDLRFNGGGYLDIAVDLLSYFLPSDTEAVIIKQRGEDDDVKYTNGSPKLLNVPLVVLINEGSASASEILAGAIQDHDRGIIMGTDSFGKGSVQEVEAFSDGSSIRMTIARWFTPNERNIDKIGLTPNIIVEISEEDVENEFDSQKEAAIDYLLKL